MKTKVGDKIRICYEPWGLSACLGNSLYRVCKIAKDGGVWAETRFYRIYTRKWVRVP